MDDKPTPPAPSDDGIARVLAAERDADRRIADARAEAERICQAAVTQERRIAERTDQRMRRLHEDLRSALEAEKSRLARDFAVELRSGKLRPDPEETLAAAEKLAHKLVGVSGA